MQVRGNLAIAVPMGGDHLAVRIPKDEEGYHYKTLHLDTFRLGLNTELDIK